MRVVNFPRNTSQCAFATRKPNNNQKIILQNLSVLTAKACCIDWVHSYNPDKLGSDHADLQLMFCSISITFRARAVTSLFAG
jgi:hypothetical protein